MIPINARRKAMLAGAQVATHSVREAAIVGGIVRCAIATGGYNGQWIAEYAVDAIASFKVVNVDRSPPNLAEVAMVLERFEEAYGRPFTA